MPDPKPQRKPKRPAYDPLLDDIDFTHGARHYKLVDRVAVPCTLREWAEGFEARHRDEKSLQHSAYSDVYRRSRDEVLATIPPEQRAPATLDRRRKPEAKPKMDAGRNYSRPGHLIKWTTREKALIARQITKMRAGGDERALSRLLIEAQELVLPEERRRPIASIQAGVGVYNDKILAEGMQNVWTLEAEPAEPAPAPLPPLELTQAAVEPAEAPQPEPISVAPPATGFSEAAQAFGHVVMGAFDTLLAKHTDVLLSHVYERLSDQAATTGAQIAAMIERGMRDTVHKLVEAELGPVATYGPSGPPPPAEPAAPAASVIGDPQFVKDDSWGTAAVDRAPAKPKIKVDVVGFTDPELVKHVTTALNGSAEVRFFDLNRHAYAPHRGAHCIMQALQKLPHAVKAKLRSAGVEPIYVRNSPHQVIHAVEELLRATA